MRMPIALSVALGAMAVSVPTLEPSSAVSLGRAVTQGRDSAVPLADATGISRTNSSSAGPVSIRAVQLAGDGTGRERIEGGTDGTAGYETRDLLGWQLHISRELLARESRFVSVAVDLLEKQLREIDQTVPATAAMELRKVPLYFSPEYPNQQPRAEYHPDVDWLRANDRDPKMAKAVEFSNIRIFEQESKRMPNFTLHELAHAYHHRFLPEAFANPEILTAHANAVRAGTYSRVERSFGDRKPNTFESAYAITSPMEYFAEATEAYFSRNDFFPFDRNQLLRHDPEMHALLTKLWGQEKPDED